MSHSKFIKRGHSLYVESWNPSAKKYINTCKVCGHQGYSPTIEEEGFCDDITRKGICYELKQIMDVLPLDEFGRCEICAKLQDKK